MQRLYRAGGSLRRIRYLSGSRTDQLAILLTYISSCNVMSGGAPSAVRQNGAVGASSPGARTDEPAEDEASTTRVTPPPAGEHRAGSAPKRRNFAVPHAIPHAVTAARLAALLPARRGQSWQVALAPYTVRPNAATSRIASGDRALVIAESGGVIEVFADRQNLFAVTPEIVVDASGPDPAAVLAARVLGSVLPRLEREAANMTVHAHGGHQVIIDKAAELNEVGFALIDHGARPVPVPRGDGVGIEWVDHAGAEWGLWVLTPTGNFTLSYSGPVGGLHDVLPVLLPSAEGHQAVGTGSVFTRRLSCRFPQLRPLDDRKVEFGGYGDAKGWIALSPEDEPADGPDDNRRVAAEFGRLGADLLLTAVPHLA